MAAAAQHLPREDHSRHLLMANRYNADLLRDGELWVMRHLVVGNVWISGDPAVLSGVGGSFT
ncbi:hypothetical protein GCM10010435_60180 [Winogradskya consettensis]|uniref:Uncharacterized protein n=1 Tax=Winogradskya consettensis TaxID=113560 RepID=A0A919SQF4_9ACTN|nr:hypothetical protein Aco04nite_50380 [Actinoplanes consettensis]